MYRRKNPSKIKTKTSMSYRSSATRLISQARNSRPRLEAYVGSDDFVEALGAMNAIDRLIALKAACRAITKFVEADAIPIPLSQPRFRRWDAALQARFETAVRKHMANPTRASLDEALAKELGMPITKVRPARWRLIGAIRAAEKARNASRAAETARVEG